MSQTQINGVCFSLQEALRRFKAEARAGVCDTGRYRCPFFTWGQGPPLLLIHGMASQARSFVPLMAHLADRFGCIAYSQPSGAGDGARWSAYRHADLAADALALLDHLGVRQCPVFATSFGTTIALRALADQPQRLPRAVLQGAFARKALARAEIRVAQVLRHWRRPMRALPGHDALQRAVQVKRFRHCSPEVLDYFLDCAGSAPMRALGMRALLLRDLDLRPRLPAIQQPVLLIRGDEDAVVHETCTAELASALPNVQRVDLPGCGHHPEFTHPAMLAELIRLFLTPAMCHTDDNEAGCREPSDR